MRVLAMVRIDKIRINDAKRLRQAGLMSGSLSLIEQEIRTFAEFPQISVFTVSDEDVLLSMVDAPYGQEALPCASGLCFRAGDR